MCGLRIRGKDCEQRCNKRQVGVNSNLKGSSGAGVKGGGLGAARAPWTCTSKSHIFPVNGKFLQKSHQFSRARILYEVTCGSHHLLIHRSTSFFYPCVSDSTSRLSRAFTNSSDPAFALSNLPQFHPLRVRRSTSLVRDGSKVSEQSLRPEEANR